MNVLHTDRLDLETLPSNAISRIALELVEDALGGAIRLPILVARGDRPGPVFGLTAALHGNELNGIPVVHRLFERLDTKKLRGTVVAVVVANVPGFLLHQREFLDGRDLNHIMPGKPNGSVSELYAHRLIDRVVRHFDYLVDLHTASFGRVNSLYIRTDLDHEVAGMMARRLRPQILLHNPPSDRTLRGTAMELGIPAVTLEIGNPHRFQKRYIQASLTGLRGLMGELGLMPKRVLAEGPSPVVCRSSEWLYTDRGGFLQLGPDVTDFVAGGEVVARLTDPYGDVVSEYVAPRAGIVIGHSVEPVGQSGARILHLGHSTRGPDRPVKEL